MYRIAVGAIYTIEPAASCQISKRGSPLAGFMFAHINNYVARFLFD